MKRFIFFSISDWDGAMKPLYFLDGKVTLNDAYPCDSILEAKTKKEALKKFNEFPNNLKGKRRIFCMSRDEQKKMEFVSPTKQR